MTVLDGLRTLFSAYPFPGRDIVWLVDEVIRIVQHTGSVNFEFLRTHAGEPKGLVCRSPGLPGDECQLPVSRVGVFRTMLARIAVMCSDETGTPFQPYGGRYTLNRASSTGPVRLDIEFTNTPGSQQLSVTRTQFARQPDGRSANGSASVVVPAAPAGA